MLIFCDNIVAIMVALLTCTYAWLFGGIVADSLVGTIPWIWVILLECMLCFPQRHSDETSYVARERAWRTLKKDPLTWVVAGFSLLLLIPFVNTGLCPICDYPLIAQGVSPDPAVPFLPWCVNRWNHLNVVMWFIPALTAMLATKHCLAKRGKRLVIEIVVWSGALLAVLGFVQQVLGAETPLWSDIFGERRAYFFSTFGYPNMGGDYFTTIFALAIGLWRWRFDKIRKDAKSHSGSGGKSGHKVFWRKHFMLIPAVICFFAALTTLSRAAIILVTLLAILFFAHTFMCIFVTLPKPKRVKACAWSLFALIGILLSVVMFMPEDLQNEVDTLNTDAVLERVTGKGQYHVRVATELWKDAPLFGIGGWGYKHLCLSKMTEDELKHIQQVGGVNVHNDYLQFLAEHGIAGFGCLVAIVVMLVWPLGRVWRALMNTVRFSTSRHKPPKPVAIFVLPAPVFCILAAAVASFIHGFGDCPFRSPAVLTLFFVELAAMDGFLPKLREE